MRAEPSVPGRAPAEDIRARELVAEAHAIGRVQQQLIERITAGIRSEQLPPPSAAIGRLFGGESGSRLAEIGVEVLGSHAVVGEASGGLGGAAAGGQASRVVPPGGSRAGEAIDVGTAFLMRQAGSLGGGSTEMARNIISERILGMPREYAADRDVPFSQVRQGR